MRKRRQQCRGEDLAACFHLARVAQDVARGTIFGRVAHDRRKERLPSPGHHRLDLKVKLADQDFSRQASHVVHVHVRIRLVAGDHRRIVDEIAGKIGVVVERDRDRQVWRDLAQPPDDLALGIVAILDDHRAVQVEHRGVAAGANRVLQRAHELLEARA